MPTRRQQPHGSVRSDRQHAPGVDRGRDATSRCRQAEAKFGRPIVVAVPRALLPVFRHQKPGRAFPRLSPVVREGDRVAMADEVLEAVAATFRVADGIGHDLRPACAGPSRHQEVLLEGVAGVAAQPGEALTGENEPALTARLAAENGLRWVRRATASQISAPLPRGVGESEYVNGAARRPSVAMPKTGSAKESCRAIDNLIFAGAGSPPARRRPLVQCASSFDPPAGNGRVRARPTPPLGTVMKTSVSSAPR